MTLKLTIAVVAFILSGGQIVFQSFQQHQRVNPKHGLVKFAVFIFSAVSLVYLAKDIYRDFDDDKVISLNAPSVTPQELDYWHSIYQNPSPENYCAYLDKYPQGQFVAIAKHGIPDGDCLQVKRQAELELKAQLEAQLQAKLAAEAKALAEQNARLEQEAKENAARIAALEQARKIEELTGTDAEARLEAELSAKFDSDTSLDLLEFQTLPEPPVLHEDVQTQSAQQTEDKTLF